MFHHSRVLSLIRPKLVLLVGLLFDSAILRDMNLVMSRTMRVHRPVGGVPVKFRLRCGGRMLCSF